MIPNILAISGSTRPHSVNEQIIKWMSWHYRALAAIELYNQIAELPHFRSDLIDKKAPPQVKAFYEAIDRADAVLVCTPEYVFSLPGSLKNALDWTVSTTVFTDKPTALIVASSSGAKAFESLQLIMTTLGSQIPEEARLLIPAVKTKVSDQGQPLQDVLAQDLDRLMHGLIRAIGQAG
jgi:chromate reductase, NAD(P)H dehydrogenase (quinone)